MDLNEAYNICSTITRKEAKNFYYAFLTLPRIKRRAIYVIYAFCRFCDDIADGDADVDEKLIQINRVRKNLERVDFDNFHEPVYLALSDVINQFNIPVEYFDSLLSGMEMDLSKSRYNNFSELEEYCYRAASVVGLMCIHVFGFKDSRAQQCAISLGLAMQLTNICRDVRDDLDLGRIYLPADEMLCFGYSEKLLESLQVTDEFTELMKYQVVRAREYFVDGMRIVDYLEGDAKVCTSLLGNLYVALLDRIEGNGYDVLSSRIRLTILEKLLCLAITWFKVKCRVWR